MLAARDGLQVALALNVGRLGGDDRRADTVHAEADRGGRALAAENLTSLHQGEQTVAEASRGAGNVEPGEPGLLQGAQALLGPARVAVHLRGQGAGDVGAHRTNPAEHLRKLECRLHSRRARSRL